MVPEDIDEVYEAFSSLYAQGRYDEALDLLSQVVHVEKSKLVYARLRCLTRLGRIDEALACCDVLDTKYHDRRVKVLACRARNVGIVSDKEALNELTSLCAHEHATRLFQKAKYAEALAVLEEMGTEDHPEFLYARARCLSKLGRVDEALACCALLDTAHNDPRGAALASKLRGNQHAFAQEILRRHKHAARLFQQARYAEALAVLEEVGTEDHPEFLYARARCLSKLGRVDEALTCCALLDTAHNDPRGAALASKLRGNQPAFGREILGHPDLLDSQEFPPLAFRSLSLPQDSIGGQPDASDGALSDAAPREQEHQRLDSDLQEQLDALNADLERACAQERAAVAAFEAMRDERDHLKDVIDQLDRAAADTAQSEAQHIALIVSLQERVNALTEDFENARERERVSAMAMEQAYAERDQLRQALEQRECEMAEGVQRAQGQGIRIQSLQAQLDAVNALVEQVRAQEQTVLHVSTEACGERDQLRQVLEQRECELAEGAQRAEELEVRIRSLQDQLDAVNALVEQVRAQEQAALHVSTEACAERDQLRQALEQRECEMAQGAQRAQEQEIRVRSLQDQLDAVNVLVEQVRSQEQATLRTSTEACAERDRFREMLDKARAASAQGSQYAMERESVISSLRQQAGALADEVARKTQSELELREQLDALRTEVLTLRRSVEEARSEEAALRQALETAGTDIHRLEEALKQRQAALADAERRRDELDRQTRELQKELRKLRVPGPRETEGTAASEPKVKRNEEQAELRLGQLRAKYAMLRVGMRTREVTRMFGDPTCVEHRDRAPVGVPGTTPVATVGDFLERGSAFGETFETWTYEAYPWGAVKLDIARGRIQDLHWVY